MITFRPGLIGPLARKKALDLGAAGGRHAQFLASCGAKVVALDIAPEAIEGAFSVAGDGVWLPFRDSSFDCVVVTEVLEHVGDPLRVASESYRVLSADGVLVASVPRAYPEAINWLLSLEYHSVPGGHVRIFTKSELIRLLTAVGFRVTAHHYSHGLHSPYWWLRSWLGIEKSERDSKKLWFEGLLIAEMFGNKWLRRLERLAAPLMGKSLVVYAKKGDEA
jgi:2-polyprenyl-3-methyl-5-hydroxy-6-metoxy-1,4-benzoquinol methylase